MVCYWIPKCYLVLLNAKHIWGLALNGKVTLLAPGKGQVWQTSCDERVCNYVIPRIWLELSMRSIFNIIHIYIFMIFASRFHILFKPISVKYHHPHMYTHYHDYVSTAGISGVFFLQKLFGEKNLLTCFKGYINGLVQDCSKYVANTLELLQSCNKTPK